MAEYLYKDSDEIHKRYDLSYIDIYVLAYSLDRA